MALDQESFNKRLYEIFKTRGYKPSPKDSKNERTNPETADVFEFQFIKDGDNYGKAWATIDKTSSLNIYYDDNQAGSPAGQTKGVDYDDSWTGLLKHLKQWALSKQLNFGLHDSDRIGDDMRQRDYYKMKEKMTEGYHAVNKTTSYNDNIPNVKVVIQHDRAVQEGEQRWRNVHKIFVENTEGERFAVPTRMPGIARVYGRHVAEGGTPYDERGKHITTLVEEYTKMAGFVRATRRGEFNESVAKLISEGVNHHKALRESLQKMRSHRGYNHYFESWTPPLMEDDSDSTSIAEMFSQGTIDPRIESVLPILNRLNSGIINEIEEVNVLDQWARGLTEITEEVIEEEKRDTHCSAKCCGADVKAEDCGCSPDCPHCNCNKKKLDEGRVKDIIHDAMDMTREEFDAKYKGDWSYDEALADYKDDDLVDEGILDKAIGSAAGKIASNPEVQKQISGMASSAGKSAGDAAVSQVNKAIPGAVNTATDQAISNLKGPAMKAGAAVAGASGLAAYGGTKLANKQDSENEMTNEGAFNRLVVDALEMPEKEFAKKHPEMAHRYQDIIDSHSEEDLTDKLNAPTQGELDLTTQQELDLDESYMAEAKYDKERKELAQLMADIKSKSNGGRNASLFKTLVKGKLSEIQNLINANKGTPAEEGLVWKFRELRKTLQGNFGDPANTAYDAAKKRADQDIDDEDNKQDDLSMQQKVDVGYAGAGVVSTIGSALAGMLENEKVNEFQKGSYGDDDKPSRPKKGKLVTKDGQAVILPLRTQDFRGDEMIVTGYKAPHKYGSTGRIYTDDGMSYFPGVADLKIIDHDYSDDIDEALTGNLAGNFAGAAGATALGGAIGGPAGAAIGSTAGKIGGALIGGELGDNAQDKIDSIAKETADNELNELKKLANLGEELIDDEDFSAKGIDKEIKMAYGILNDPRFKGGNMAGAIKAIEGIMPGLSEHPGVKKAIYMTQNEPDDLSEIVSGGQTFAGDYKTGKAGQWRNTGPTKGKPAKVGDLVGAESKYADDEMSTHQMSDEELADHVGCSTEYAKANREECEEVANEKSQDHVADNMLEDILRLSGRTEYTGESTGKGAGTQYKGYGR